MIRYKIKIDNWPYIIETEKEISEKELKMCIRAYISGYNADAENNVFKFLTVDKKIEYLKRGLTFAIDLGKIEIKEYEKDNFVIEI